MDPVLMNALQMPTFSGLDFFMNLLLSWAVSGQNVTTNGTSRQVDVYKDVGEKAAVVLDIVRASLAERIASQVEQDEKHPPHHGHRRREKRTATGLPAVFEDALLNPTVPVLDPMSLIFNLLFSWTKSIDKPHKDM